MNGYVEKPWGHEEIWARTDKYVGKVLFIKKGHRLSLQYHNVKDETIRVIHGMLTFTLGDQVLTLAPGESIHVKPGTVHRMEAKETDVILVEVSTTELDDVIRLADDYGR